MFVGPYFVKYSFSSKKHVKWVSRQINWNWFYQNFRFDDKQNLKFCLMNCCLWITDAFYSARKHVRYRENEQLNHTEIESSWWTCRARLHILHVSGCASEEWDLSYLSIRDTNFISPNVLTRLPSTFWFPLFHLKTPLIQFFYFLKKTVFMVVIY